MQRYKTFRHMQEKIQKISPIKQRILQFIDTLGISKRDFYAKTGISRGTLESGTGITEDTIAKVFATYSNLSPSWIFLNQGEMLINQNKAEINAHPNVHPNVHLSDKNGNLNGTSSNNDKKKEQCLNIDFGTCQTSTELANKFLNNESEISVPFYDLPVSAGSLGILDIENSNITIPAGHIKLPIFRGCEAIFPIIGISMEPLVHSGDWIGIKSIDNLSRSWDFIQTGVIYLIITREDRMIKFIEKSDDDDFIICSSPNYHPFKVYKGDILNIYRVKAVARGL